MTAKEVWNQEYEKIIDSASPGKMSRDDDPARWGLTTDDISMYLYLRWASRARAMKDEQERIPFGNVCWAILQRNDPGEMMTYLSERDLVIITRDKFGPRDSVEDEPLTFEEMQRLANSFAA